MIGMSNPARICYLGRNRRFPLFASRALVALLGASACSGPEPMGPGDVQLPLGTLHFVAEASGLSDGLQVDCTIDGRVEVKAGPEPAGAMVIYRGTEGGDARRTVRREDGSGVDFWADYYKANLQVRLLDGDRIEIRDVTEYPDKGTSRFWDAMLLFQGNLAEDGPGDELAHGEWTCFPMDTPSSSGGYTDVSGTATGSWRLLRLPPS